MKKIPEYFFLLRILVTSHIDNLKYFYSISKLRGVVYLYHKYFKHVTSFALDFSNNDAPGYSRFSDIFSKIHG